MEQPTTGGSEGGFLHPERIASYFGIQPGMKAADFGAGHGFFTIPMARLTGPEGKVYAFDIQKDTLEVIRSKARLEHLLNIETVWADIELPNGSKLPNSSVDFVLASNIIFQAESKQAIFAEAARILKQNGKLAVIEWDESPFAGGPAAEMRVSKNLVKNLAAESGLELDREFEAGSHHYGLLFIKK